MSRKKNRAEDLKEKAVDIKDKATFIAGESKPALKDFSSTTGTAAKDFATTTFKAAKELLEAVEKAGEKLERHSHPVRRRGGKVVKSAIALTAGVMLFTNQKVRGIIRGKLMGANDQNTYSWDTPAPGTSNNPPGPETTTTPAVTHEPDGSKPA